MLSFAVVDILARARRPQATERARQRPRNAALVAPAVDHVLNFDSSMAAKKKSKVPTPAIVMAAHSGDLAAVKGAVESGADVNAVDRGGGTALHQAVVSRSLPIVEVLLAHGGDATIADGAGRTPLHYAARYLQSNIAKRLLDAGASVDAQDVNGNTPLSDAVFATQDDPTMILLLLVAGADMTRKNKHGERIWKTYVPPSGQATTVQGELLRGVEKLRDEAQRNGNVNWDDGHKTLARFVRETLTEAELFDAKQIKDITKDVDRLLDYEHPETGEDVYDRLVERVVDWCRAHPEPVPHRVDRQGSHEGRSGSLGA